MAISSTNFKLIAQYRLPYIRSIRIDASPFSGWAAVCDTGDGRYLVGGRHVTSPYTVDHQALPVLTREIADILTGDFCVLMTEDGEVWTKKAGLGYPWQRLEGDFQCIRRFGYNACVRSANRWFKITDDGLKPIRAENTGTMTYPYVRMTVENNTASIFCFKRAWRLVGILESDRELHVLDYNARYVAVQSAHDVFVFCYWPYGGED